MKKEWLLLLLAVVLVIPFQTTNAKGSGDKTIVSNVDFDDDRYQIGDTLTLTVTMSDPVAVEGTPELKLEIGDTVVSAVYASGTSDQLTFTYTVVEGTIEEGVTSDERGVVVEAFHLPTGASIKNKDSGDEIDYGLEHIAPFSNVKVDGIPPVVQSVTVPDPGSYKAGDTLSFFVQMSEAMAVRPGRVWFDLTIGSEIVKATYSPYEPSLLLFSYTIKEGDTDSDGIAIGSEISVLTDTNFRDLLSNLGVRTLNNVGPTNGVLVDTTPPPAPEFTSGWNGSSGSFTLRGTGETDSVVHLYVDGEFRTTGTVRDGQWSIPLSGLREQTYLIQAKAVDLAGNESELSGEHSLVIVYPEASDPEPGPQPEQEQEQVRHINIDAGSLDDAVQVRITRDSSGDRSTDRVDIDESVIGEAVKKAVAADAKQIRVWVDDLPDNPADEIQFRISKEGMQQIADTGMNLEIVTDNGTILVPADAFDSMEPLDELYFRFIPIREEEERQEVVARTEEAPPVLEIAGGRAVTILGTPMTIETNLRDIPVRVVFPIDPSAIPNDPAERAAFLASLGVYIEHSDGERVLKTGEIVFDENGKPIGLAIDIDKFSTFTMVSIEGEHPTETRLPYISGYPDHTFRPDSEITRAEMAFILSRLIAKPEELSEASPPFGDVRSTHWANESIAFVTRTGLMEGDGNHNFRPDDSVTRGEMAAILARWLRLPPVNEDSGFADTRLHWSSGYVTAASEQALASGYPDGTFRPDSKLTRAEAVVFINRAIGLKPLQEAASPLWLDVPVGHWALGAIEAASIKH